MENNVNPNMRPPVPPQHFPPQQYAPPPGPPPPNGQPLNGPPLNGPPLNGPLPGPPPNGPRPGGPSATDPHPHSSPHGPQGPMITKQPMGPNVPGSYGPNQQIDMVKQFKNMTINTEDRGGARSSFGQNKPSNSFNYRQPDEDYYEGWTLYPGKSEGVPDWSWAEKVLMHMGQKQLAKVVRKNQKEFPNRQSGMHLKRKVVVDCIIRDLKKQDPSPEYNWTLVYVKEERKKTRHNGDTGYVVIAMDIIVKRHFRRKSSSSGSSPSPRRFGGEVVEPGRPRTGDAFASEEPYQRMPIQGLGQPNQFPGSAMAGQRQDLHQPPFMGPAPVSANGRMPGAQLPSLPPAVQTMPPGIERSNPPPPGNMLAHIPPPIAVPRQPPNPPTRLAQSPPQLIHQGQQIHQAPKPPRAQQQVAPKDVQVERRPSKDMVKVHQWHRDTGSSADETYSPTSPLFDHFEMDDSSATERSLGSDGWLDHYPPRRGSTYTKYHPSDGYIPSERGYPFQRRGSRRDSNSSGSGYSDGVGNLIPADSRRHRQPVRPSRSHSLSARPRSKVVHEGWSGHRGPSPPGSGQGYHPSWRHVGPSSAYDSDYEHERERALNLYMQGRRYQEEDHRLQRRNSEYRERRPERDRRGERDRVGWTDHSDRRERFDRQDRFAQSDSFEPMTRSLRPSLEPSRRRIEYGHSDRRMSMYN